MKSSFRFVETKVRRGNVFLNRRVHGFFWRLRTRACPFFLLPRVVFNPHIPSLPQIIVTVIILNKFEFAFLPPNWPLLVQFADFLPTV